MTATTTRTSTRSILLESALRGNVVFSLFSGAVLLVGSTWLADVIGPPAWALALVGVGVIGFGISIARGMHDHLLATGRLAMIADLAWLAVTVGLAPLRGPLVQFGGGLGGRWGGGGGRRLRSSRMVRPSSGSFMSFRIEASRIVDHDPESVWEVLANQTA